MSFGRFAATTQFYLYGRKHFTRTGWENHQKKYETPDILESIDLSGRVFMVTGANSGVGKELTTLLVKRSGTVYMVCRSKERAEAAQKEIVEASGDPAAMSRVHVLLADCGLRADVNKVWQDFVAKCSTAPHGLRLDALVCNAGALLNERKETSEGVEVTFASHLVYGTYLLGKLALSVLDNTPNSRLVVVSSGGMYNVAFPKWSVAASTGSEKYDGQFAYAYAKRGQVILAEQWAQKFPKVKVVSTHPGWTDTPAVEEAYGAQKSYLEPMRTLWQGSEGISWLCVAPAEKIESGAFYLDREPQVKHMAGPFFTEGSVTKNSELEVAEMMRKLEDWSEGHIVKLTVDPSQPLAAMSRAIDLKRFVGKWYVIANIPTIADRNTVNNVEEYTLDDSGKTILVDFTYSSPGSTKRSSLQQKATVISDAGTEWRISPKVGLFLPLNLPYLVVDCAEDYSTTIIGVPDRAYVWIMARTPQIEPATLKPLMDKCEELGYDLTNLVMVPQNWETPSE